MGNITIKNLTFAYPGQAPLFDRCQLSIDGSWKLGLLGRNGRGKTTLMKILLDQREFQGQVQGNLPFAYFPQPIADPDALAWEALSEGNPQLEQWQVERELRLMAVDPVILWQPFASLSGGEQTKLLLAALFAQPGSFPLLDEPTNHLDQRGRRQVADYLQNKHQGFIITSHDQDFLDRVIDHTLVIECHQLVLERGNSSTYFAQKSRRDQQAISQNGQLHADIKRLRSAKQQRLQWAQRAEHEKQNNAHADKGFIGAEAAKMMKKSLTMTRRLDQAASDKEGVLQEVEEVAPLTITQLPSTHPTPLGLDQVGLTANCLITSVSRLPLMTVSCSPGITAAASRASSRPSWASPSIRSPGPSALPMGPRSAWSASNILTSMAASLPLPSVTTFPLTSC